MNSYQDMFNNSLKPHPKILAIGKNYENHVKEMGGWKPEEPIIFQKPMSSIYVPSEHQFIYTTPRHGRLVHHETELGFMIGKSGKHIKPEQAMEHVGGYFLALDMTDRELQAQAKKLSTPWDLSKGQDNFTPISSFVEKSDVEDPHQLQLLLEIDGQVVQDDSTSNMIDKIPAIISHISQFMTLNAGDLVLTGTPSGVGPFKEGNQVVAKLLQKGKTLAFIQFKVAGSE